MLSMIAAGRERKEQFSQRLCRRFLLQKRQEVAVSREPPWPDESPVIHHRSSKTLANRVDVLASACKSLWRDASQGDVRILTRQSRLTLQVNVELAALVAVGDREVDTAERAFPNDDELVIA